jgi:hypothetical protein
MSNRLRYTKGGLPIAGAMVIGIEDFGVLVGENQDTINRIDHDTVQTDRLLDQSEYSEQFADVASAVEKADPVTLAMTEVASKMSTVGTDLNADSMVAGIESWEGLTIGVEGFRETALEIVRWVLGKVQEMMRSVMSIWDNFTDMSANIKHRAHEIQIKARDKKNAVADKNKTIPFGLQAKHLCINGMMPKDGANILGYLNNQYKIADKVYSVIAAGTLSCGAIVRDQMLAYTGQNLDSLLAETNDKYLQSLKRMQQVFTETVKEDSRFNQDSEILALPGIMGNKTLYYIESKMPENGTDDPIADAMSNRSAQILLSMYDSQPDPVDRNYSVRAFPAVDSDRIATMCLDIVAKIDQYKVTTLSRLTSLQEAIDKANKNAALKTNVEDDVNRRYWKALSSYSLAFSKLINSGTQAFTQQLLQSCSASLVIAERSVDELV